MLFAKQETRKKRSRRSKVLFEKFIYLIVVNKLVYCSSIKKPFEEPTALTCQGESFCEIMKWISAAHLTWKQTFFPLVKNERER